MSKLHHQVPLALIRAALAAGPVLAEQVSPVTVEARAPTSVIVPLAGKTPAAVRQDIRVAARYVCANAVAMHDLSPLDTNWCSDMTNHRAQASYRQILARDGGSQIAAAGTTLTVAMR